MFGRFRRRRGLRRGALLALAVAAVVFVGRTLAPRMPSDPSPLAEGAYRVASVESEGGFLLAPADAEDSLAQVRLLGIEFADPPWLTEAVTFLREKTVGRTVDVELDSHRLDEQGRLAGHLRVEGESLGEMLVARGLARVDRRAGHSRAITRLVKLQREAQQQRLGMWADGASIPTPDETSPPVVPAE